MTNTTFQKVSKSLNDNRQLVALVVLTLTMIVVTSVAMDGALEDELTDAPDASVGDQPSALINITADCSTISCEATYDKQLFVKFLAEEDGDVTSQLAMPIERQNRSEIRITPGVEYVVQIQNVELLGDGQRVSGTFEPRAGGEYALVLGDRTLTIEETTGR